MVLISALPVVSMTFDEVGAPARLSAGPSPDTLLMAIQSTFDLEPEEPLKKYEEPLKRYEKNGRVTAIILV